MRHVPRTIDKSERDGGGIMHRIVFGITERFASERDEISIGFRSVFVYFLIFFVKSINSATHSVYGIGSAIKTRCHPMTVILPYTSLLLVFIY